MDKEYHRRWRKSHKENQRLADQRYENSHREKINKDARREYYVKRYSPSFRFGQLKTLAKRLKRVVGITKEKYTQLLLQGCHYCGQDLRYFSGYSLDRIDNDKGYEESNVLPCCGRCNKVRGIAKLTVSQMERIGKLL